LQKFADRALRLCLETNKDLKTELRSLAEVSILLVSDDRMAAIHEEFMGEAGPTDVITFEHGEIFISAPTARRNARRFGSALMREIELYIVHGLLHLHGFDDRTAAQARVMAKTQRRVLRRAGAKS
jgi:probable rRNA maturation factor